MKENDKDILAKAIEELKKEQIPTGPSEELLQATTAKLNEVAVQSTQRAYRKISILDWLTTKAPLKLPIKVAAAAVLLVAAGYTIGRLTRPRAIDVDGLYHALEASLATSLEPAIHQRLLEDMNRRWQLTLAGTYTRLKDGLSNQYRQELEDLALQILATSSTATNERLEELIDAINTAQVHDRKWVTAALEQIELNRIRDNAQLSNALVTFAVQTEDELLRTKQDVAHLLSYTQPGGKGVDKSDNLNNLN